MFTCYILVFWTLFPRQGVLERAPEIENTPREDHVVVESHEETHLIFGNKIIRLHYGLKVHYATFLTGCKQTKKTDFLMQEIGVCRS